MSIDGLNRADPGVRLLARAVADEDPRDVLLVCCGDVPGLAGAPRMVLDVRELSEQGARPFSCEPPPADAPRVRHALVWPRAHLGKDFTLACLAYGALAVGPGGRVWCAVRKAKGADSIARHFAALAGPVRTVARDRGYRLLGATVGEDHDPTPALEALGRRYTISDPLLGEAVLRSAPGVFSRRELDAGTRCLLQHVVDEDPPAPARVLDLGAGVGPITVFAAQRWPRAHVLAVEPNCIAVARLTDNVAALAASSRVTVAHAAGLRGVAAAADLRGRIDRALVNPPTHLSVDGLTDLVAQVHEWLRPGGHAQYVVARADALATPLRRAGVRVEAHAYDRYTVVDAHTSP